MSEPERIALFSYGTLRQAGVQMANYGRLLDGEPDELAGYRRKPVTIADPNVVKISGRAIHTIAVASGNLGDRIEGMVFHLTEAELAATDAYETKAYARIEVELESGRLAWAYVAA
jgi:gamma-glutamylcyclotransferase (GGCT)/AIG2-like uncharacterized protein YtfP